MNERMNDWFNETHRTCIKHCCVQIHNNYNTAGNTPIKTKHWT